MINIATSNEERTITPETLGKIGEVSDYLKKEVAVIMGSSASTTPVYVRNYPRTERNLDENEIGIEEKLHLKCAMEIDPNTSMTIQVPKEDIEAVKKIIAA